MRAYPGRAGPRQRGRDLRHERRPAADDRAARPRCWCRSAGAAVFVWIGVAHLVLLPLMLALPGAGRGRRPSEATARRACRCARRRGTRQFWLLLAIYAICGLDDFLRHHARGGVRAGPRPRRAVRRQPAGADGTDRARRASSSSGLASDRLGPVWPTAAAFVARIIVFGLDRDRSVAVVDRGVRAGVRRDVPRHRAAHRGVRARKLRHEESRRARRA